MLNTKNTDSNNAARHPVEEVRNFVNLPDVLPLGMPLAIMIEPTNLCNFACKYCPTAYPELLKGKRPLGSMNFELYCKIVDDIAEMCEDNKSKIRLLQLWKDGEPLLNKQISKMVEYANNKKISETICITTNASALTNKIATSLINSGLDWIRISVQHVNKEGYKNVTQIYDNYERIKSNVEFLYNEKIRLNSNLLIDVKIVDLPLTVDEKNKFQEDFKNICDRTWIDQLQGWSDSDTFDWSLGASTNPQTNNKYYRKERVVCPDPFSKLAVNFNGTCSICCVDWSHATVVGDVNDVSLKDIWNGEELRKFRLHHLKGNRDKLSACKNCDYMKFKRPQDNLDNDRERLISIYSNKE